VIEIPETQEEEEDDEIEIVAVKPAPKRKRENPPPPPPPPPPRKRADDDSDDEVVFVSETPAPPRGSKKKPKQQVDEEVVVLAPTELSERTKTQLLTKLLAEKQELAQQVQSLQARHKAPRPAVAKPGYWRRDGVGRRLGATDDPENGAKYALVDLDADGDEYSSIARRFQSTGCADAEVASIKRVHNDSLWRAFSARRALMTEAKTAGSDYSGGFPQDTLPGLAAEDDGGVATDPACERYLFHGASPKTIEAILSSGIDFRLSQTTGAMGACAYFADQASYSHNYCVMPDHAAQQTTGGRGRGGAGYHRGGGGGGYLGPGATLRMLVCRVLVGDCTRGAAGLRRPPAKPTGDGTDLFDSVSNNPDQAHNYSSQGFMFGVFDNAQVYPEYVIEYTKSRAAHPAVPPVVPPVLNANLSGVALAVTNVYRSVLQQRAAAATTGASHAARGRQRKDSSAAPAPASTTGRGSTGRGSGRRKTGRRL